MQINKWINRQIRIMLTIINKCVHVKTHSNMAVWEAFPSENYIFGFDFAISMSSAAVMSLT